MIFNFESRGDTLIEVLFAVTVFSLVAVGGISVMNQGMATSQRALEITMVRNEIDAQAETLRFLNSSYIAAYKKGKGYNDYPNQTPAKEWLNMKLGTSAVMNATVFGTGATSCPSAPQYSFILDTDDARYISSAGNLLPAVTFSQVDRTTNMAYGVWIEAVSSAVDNSNNQSSAGYVDFHIRACWDSPGQSIPVTIGTIVRLYEPR